MFVLSWAAGDSALPKRAAGQGRSMPAETIRYPRVIRAGSERAAFAISSGMRCIRRRQMVTSKASSAKFVSQMPDWTSTKRPGTAFQKARMTAATPGTAKDTLEDLRVCVHIAPTETLGAWTRLPASATGLSSHRRGDERRRRITVGRLNSLAMTWKNGPKLSMRTDRVLLSRWCMAA